MKETVWVSLIALVQLFAPSTAAGAIRVMILDGQSGGPYHDWQRVTPVLRKQLEATGLFQVDVVTAPQSGGDFSVFKPEFIGRLDEIIVFHKLTDENMRAIVEIELAKVRERLKERGLSLVLTDEAKQFVIEKSRRVEGDRESTDYGARPLRRSVEMYVEDPLAEELLRGEFQGKTRITVKLREVGGEKSLEFTGSMEEGAPEAELASAGA